MSIEQHDVIDFARRDKETGDVVLSITDHLNWDNPEDHFWQIQEKLNTYIRYIESGEILEKFPEAKNKKILIEFVHKEKLPEAGKQFIEKCNATLEKVPAEIRSLSLLDK